jgi:hypothetical protein
MYFQLLEASRLTRFSRIFLISGAIGILAAGAFALVDTRRVTLESDGNRREYRRVDHDGYVRLSRRLSDAPCIQGRTWGYDRDGIWVSNGCRAIFEYSQNSRGNNGSWQDRWDDRRNDRRDDRYNNDYYGRNTVRVESEDGRYRSKSIDTRGGVRLLRTLSDRPCVQGRSWGYDRNRIWVDDGCRGIFEVGTGSGYGYGGGYGNGGYGNGGYGGYNDYGYGDSCPSWLPGRYSGYGDGGQFELNIDRNGRVTLRQYSNGRWGNEQRGYYRDNSVHVGDWSFGISRERNSVQLRSNRGKSRLDLRKN